MSPCTYEVTGETPSVLIDDRYFEYMFKHPPVIIKANQSFNLQQAIQFDHEGGSYSTGIGGC